MMLSVQPTMAPSQVRALLQATARPFPTTGGTSSGGSPAPQCAVPQPLDATQVDQLECYCTTSTCGAGMLDAGAAVRAAAGASANYTGLFWQSPAGIAPGWGINFAHAGDQIFATWYTYDAAGKAWWLSMLANRPAPTGNAFSGPIYVDTGPPFDAFNGSAVPTSIGHGQLTMTDADNGTFAYTVNGVAQIKPLTRFDVGTGPRPACVYTASTPDFAAATNYQGLWWAARRHRSRMGDQLRAPGQRDLRDVVHLRRQQRAAVAVGARDVDRRRLQRNALSHAGPTFSNYDSSQWAATAVGTATIAFADGNHATFELHHQRAGRVASRHAEQAITRFAFATIGRNALQVGAAARHRGRRVRHARGSPRPLTVIVGPGAYASCARCVDAAEHVGHVPVRDLRRCRERRRSAARPACTSGRRD